MTRPYHLDNAISSVDVALYIDEMEVLEEPYIPRKVIGFV